MDSLKQALKKLPSFDFVLPFFKKFKP